jgi:Ca2+-transporting ATPase
MGFERKQYTGLTEEQVEESRRMHGSNVLTPPERESLWMQYLGKFSDPLIIVLMVAGLLSVGISFYEYYGLGEGATVFFEPVGIFVAIALATGLAFVFELKADREFSVLNSVNDDEQVEVIRSGNVKLTARRDVVVGDIVIVNTGDEVPADAELIDSVSLYVDESSLNGESVPTYKSAEAEGADTDASYPANHLMRGTKVMEGHGVCRVFAVGDKTENGRVYQAAQIDDSVKTPLNEQLDGLSDLITKLSYGFAAVIIVARLAVYFATVAGLNQVFASAEGVSHFLAYLLQTVMIAVTLIVVAVPEGLPMAVTLSLAYSMRRMLKTNNLVRRMHACETMGATTVICTDKTGTLTQNRMRVASTDFYGLPSQKLGSDRMSLLIKEGIAVNSTAQLDMTDRQQPDVIGNPTEGALLMWLHENGEDYVQLKNDTQMVGEIPFSTDRKYMATLVRSALGDNVLYVKGAPEVVLAMCSSVCGGVTDEEIKAQLAEYQKQAMRTLGLACCKVAGADDAIRDGAVRADNLTFLGIVAISDPVRRDVPEAVKECMDAGIAVKIVTGDTSGTAIEIARQIGLWNEADGDRNIITGQELACLTDDELKERVADLKIISRARPMDKKRLVEALQALGEVVAVTGDGTNDAPALRAAHVGLSMGDGTSVAKDASDITIIDNSFASIGRAVMWGRSLYQNIQRFLLFQLTVNVAACFLVLAGAFMGVESPLTVTQMLWVNLIMDTFGAMALSSLPPTERVMKDRPRDRNAFILNRSMLANIIGVGGFFFLMLTAFLYIFQHADVERMSDLLCIRIGGRNGVTPYELTLLFSIFVWTHFWYLFNARGYKSGGSGLQLKGCNGFLTIAAVIVAGQVLIVEVLYDFFNVVPMKWQDWLIIVAGSSLVVWVREAFRLLFHPHR